MNISKHITLAEATKSQQALRLGISNQPTKDHLENMKALAEHCFEPLRDYFGVPIAVTSFYRSPELNSAIGGSKSSQHCKGEAMDIDADVFGNLKNSQIFYWLVNNVIFDQLIWEFGTKDQPDWVHVSFRRDGKNRKQILRAIKDCGTTIYKEMTV